MADKKFEIQVDVKDLNQSMPENLAAWEKYKKRIYEVGEQSEGLTKKLTELGEAAEAGGMGKVAELLKAADNPAALIVTTLATGMEEYFKWVEKTEEKYKESVEAVQKINDEQRRMITAGPSLFDEQKKVSEAIAQARSETTGLGAELSKFEGTAKVFDIYAADTLQQQQRQRLTELDLMKQRIELMKAMHQISSEQAQQEQIQVEHQKKVQGLTDDLENKKAAVNQAETDENNELNIVPGGRAGFSPAAIGAAQHRSDEANENYRRASELAKNGAEEIGALEKQIEENTKKAKDDPLNQARYLSSNQSIRDQIEVIKAQLETANASLPGLLQEKTSAQNDLSTLKGLSGKFEQMDQHIRELKQQYIDANSALPKDVQQENTRYLLESLTALINSRNESPQQIAAQGVKAVQSGQQNEQTEGLQELLQATGFSHQQIVQIMNRLVNHHLSFQDVLTGVMQRVAALEQQMPGAHGWRNATTN